ncbi:MAG TPA: hypothetical protein VK929_00855 [Longimicrobiales bacterium]|nr:hypothetical protein [Longimicrobiales bacterium]
MSEVSTTVRNGLIAGAIGGTVLAGWFTVLDLVRGAPLATLGVLAGVISGRDPADAGVVMHLLYVFWHYVAFCGLGVAVALLFDGTGFRRHWIFGILCGFLLFDIMFYATLAASGVNIVLALGWANALFANVLAGMALFGWLQYTATEEAPRLRDLVADQPVLREGLLAGAIGAVVVAAWFLILDLAQGRAFFTPAALGSAVFLGADSAAEVQRTWAMVVAYTAAHVAAFVAIGIMAAAILRGVRQHPPLILGAVLLFVTLETFFIGLIAIAAAWLVQALSWWTIAAANVLAAGSMGGYLWRAHPELHAIIRRQDIEGDAGRGPHAAHLPARRAP